MVEIVRHHRNALLRLVKGAWQELWLVTPAIDAAGVQLLLPELRRRAGQIRVIADLTPDRLANGHADLGAFSLLRDLPGCEIRHLKTLPGSVFAAAPEGPVLVTGISLSLAGIDGDHAIGALCHDAAPVLAELERLWDRAEPLTETAWTALTMETSRRLEARTVGEEIARIGAFVRVSVFGTRKTRRLDPHEYGVPERDWGRAVRPVEVALYKLDDVIQARADLEAVLADKGIKWNEQYLVPRHFLERDWPAVFEARKHQLQERLTSDEGKAALKAQLGQARRELEAFFTDLWSRVDAPGMDAPTWVDVQVTRVLAETVTESILAESGLEYRVLTMMPEDPRSVAEMWRLLEDPKLRSVQLTFNF